MLKKIILDDNIKFKIIRHVIFWLSIYFYFGLLSGYLYGMTALFLKSKLIYVLITIPFIYFLLYFIYPKYFVKRRYGLFTIFYLLTMFAEISVRMFYYLKIEPTIFKGKLPMPLADFFEDELILHLVNFIVISMSRFVVISLIPLVTKILKNWHKSILKNKELEKMTMEHKMSLLRNQIHPHFLFNTLNNLYSITLDNSKASRIILKISDILRYMLKEHNKEKVTLKEELDIINYYIDLEKLRYGEELDVELKNKVNAQHQSSIKGPPLVLFTFVENAFKHGARKAIGNSWIKITIKYDTGIFYFIVENSKEKEDYEVKSNNKNTGIGLKNARATLDLYFPKNYILDIINEPDKFKIKLQINYKAYDN